MDILLQIISSLTKEEVRHFKLFSMRTRTKEERKDLKLFDYIRKNQGIYEEDHIFKKLYPNEQKNPFYRLKNRLQTDLNKSLVLQYGDKDEIITLFHLLSLSKVYMNKGIYGVNLYFLKMAEKKAVSAENYVILDYIYGELIKLSFEIMTINPEEYIQKRKENREKLKTLNEMDDILAAVSYRMKITQNLGSGNEPILELLEKTVNDFADQPTVIKNPKLRFTLYQAVSRILITKKDYTNLEPYLLKTYEEFDTEGLFTKSNHQSKLQLITYIINTLYQNGKYEESINFCNYLKEAIQEHGAIFEKKFQVFYYNGLILNLLKKDLKKATEVLGGLIREKTFKDTPFYEFLFLTNLAVCHYKDDKPQTALKTLVKVHIHDGYENADPSLKFNIAIFELIIRSEISDYDTIKKRIERVKKTYSGLLDQPEYSNDLIFIKILSGINKSIDSKTDDKLLNEIRFFLKNKPDEFKRQEMIYDYYNWLESKYNDRIKRVRNSES